MQVNSAKYLAFTSIELLAGTGVRKAGVGDLIAVSRAENYSVALSTPVTEIVSCYLFPVIPIAR